MKKLTTIVAALALFVSASAFNSGPDELSNVFKLANVKVVSAANVNNSVTRAFKQKYAKAENVTWSQAENFYFASFDLKDNNFSVAYNDEGEFIAISRKLAMDQISMAAAEALREQFQGYLIPEAVTEIVLLGETHYYLTVEGPKAYYELKCSPNGNISVEKKIKKKVLIGKVY